MTEPLRDRLAAALPRFPLKKAWPVVVRSARSWHRRTGRETRLGSRADLERLLARTDATDEDVAELKSALATVLRSPEEDAPAAALNAIVDQLLPRFARGLVPLGITDLPLGFGAADLRRLTGLISTHRLIDAVEATILVRRFDGMLLGGSRLRVDVDLPSGRVLPPPPRHLRADPAPRSRPAPWLTHLDEEGRWSLTPDSIARRQAHAATGSSVIDVGCGCGGNTVAFAEAGFSVVAIEPDPERRRLAAANIEARHVSDRVRLLDGTAAERLPGLLRADPQAAVFVDPPWGGPDWPRRAMSWDELIDPLGVSTDTLRAGGQLLLKAPRTFDVTTLPGPGTWAVQYEFGEIEDDQEVVKCITASAWSSTVRGLESTL
jgi:SAM-dependent methyltransferase